MIRAIHSLLAILLLVGSTTVYGQYVNPNAEVINDYAKVVDFPSCSSCLGNCDVVTVDDASNFAESDRVLLIQMKGANISWEDDSTFGEIHHYGSAGFHELMQIKSVNGNEIQFTNAIQAAYDVAGSVQVVKIVEIEGDYTVGIDGITCNFWNGNTGGVIYLEVGGTLTLNGDIDVRGRGFRGAQNPNDNADVVHCGTSPQVNGQASWINGLYTIDLANIQYSGRKGEGIAEFRNPLHELGKGPLASGGGGGINHNAGGGGGSNMGAGGFGGHEYDYDTRNCGRELRGLGGKRLDRLGGLRLFLGGGGGAGHENNNVGTSGGSGGGIIILKANKIEGNGHKIIANGTRGPRYVLDPITGAIIDSSSYAGGNDGCGGGGAGGSIKLECHDFDDGNLIIQARGSDGGDMGSVRHGPGGGGGGGLVCFITQEANTAGIQITSEGGLAGVTNGSLPDGSPEPWGAEPGEAGLTAYECATLETPPPRELTVSLGPDLHLCNPPSAILNSRQTEPLYVYNWYKDGEKITGATSPSYTAGDAGTYSIELLSPNCPATYDTVVITKEGDEYSIDTTFCNEEGAQIVDLAIGNPTPGANYGWYDAETDGNLIFAGNPYKTDPLDASVTYYVTDTNKVRASIGPSPTSNMVQVHYVGDPSNNNADVTIQEHTSSFNVEVPIKLKSVDVHQKEYTSGCNAIGSSRTITINLLENGSQSGQSATASISCGQLSTVPLNFDIVPDINYTLQFSSNPKGAFLMVDNSPNGESIPGVITIEDHIKVSGPFFDWKIEYGAPCGRMPVSATLFCDPCIKPKPLQLSLDHTENYLCEGESAFIQTNEQYNANDYDFVWYNSQDTANNRLNTEANTSISSLEISATEAGTYAVLVRDKNKWDDFTCWSYAEITIKSHLKPTYTITGSQEVCDYDTTAPIEVNFTGESPWSFTLSSNATPITSTSDTYSVSQPEAGNYGLVALSDKYCSATIDANEFATVTVNASPGKPVVTTALQSIYKGQDIPEFEATGNNLIWYNEDFSETLATGTTLTPTVSDTGRYVFKIIDENLGCTDTSEVVLLVSGCPSPMPIPNSQKYCYGETNTPEISATPVGSGTLYWFDEFVFTKDNALTSGNTLQTNDKAPGEYTYYVSEFDPLEVCFGPYQEVTISIHKAPEASIILDTLLCADQSTVPFTATPEGGTLSSITATGGISGSGTTSDPFTFDPTFNGFVSDSYIFDYTVSEVIDATSGKACDTTVQTSTEVQATAPPLSITPQIILIDDAIPTFEATGENIQWYYGTSVTKADSYTPFSLNGQVGTYTFEVTQTIKGCESDPIETQLQIIDCDAQKPTVINTERCIGYTDTPELIVSSTGNVSWFSSPSTSLTPIATTASFAPSDTDDGIYQYYVAEYDATHDCWGPFSTAEFTVHPLPEVTIVAEDTICYDNGLLSINTFPGSVGTYTESAGMIGDTFDPTTFGKSSGEHLIVYEYTHNITGCTNSDSLTIFVQYTEPPIVQDGGGLTIDLTTADPLSAIGDQLKWYSDLTTHLPSEDGKTAFKPNHSSAGDYTYYASQTILGCESELVPATYSLSDCPAPRPIIRDSAICVADNLPTYTAQQGEWKITQVGASEFRWYDRQTGIMTTGATFVPDVSYQGTEGIYNFAVSEYDLFNNCEGPTKEFSLEIIKQPSPTITAEILELCIYEAKNTLKASIYTGDIHWYENISSPAIGTGSDIEVSFTSSGVHTYYATDTDVCTSEPTIVTFTVNDIPTPPVVSNAEDCFGEVNLSPMSATGTNIQWYNDAKQKLDNNQSLLESPKITIGAHTFYATQTSDKGCLSDYSEVTYTVLPLPATPSGETKTICEHWPMINLSTDASEATITWTNDVDTYNGSSITPTLSQPGTYDFSITQTDANGCTSAEGQAQLTINPTPIAPSISDESSCTGKGSVTLRATGESLAKFKWFENTDTTSTEIGTGNTFTSSQSASGSYSYHAIQINQHNCWSSFGTGTHAVYQTPEAPIVSSLTACEGTPIRQFTNTQELDWYIGENTTPVVSNSFAYTPDDSILPVGIETTFAATASNNQCTSDRSTFTYTITPKPLPPYPNKSLICIGEESPILSVFSETESVIWEDSIGSIVQENTPFYMPSYSEIGSYYYLVSQSLHGCDSDKAILDFVIAPIPEAKITGDSLGCYDTYRVPYTVIGDSKNQSYLWETATEELVLVNALDSDNTRTADFFHSFLDTIQITVTDNSSGCTNLIEHPVAVADDPDPDFTYEVFNGIYTIKYYNESYQKPITTNGRSIEVPMHFYWDFGKGDTAQHYQHGYTIDPENNDTIPFYETSLSEKYGYGDYPVTLTAINSHGCRKPVRQIVHMEITTGLYFPSAFIPKHGSPLLSVFKPMGHNLESYDITIFDSWGNTIWFSNALTEYGSPQECWDGNDKHGNPLPADVYIWKVSATFRNGEEWQGIELENGKTSTFGNVLLMR